MLICTKWRKEWKYLMFGWNVTNCIGIDYFVRFYNDKKDNSTNNKTEHFLHIMCIFEQMRGRNDKNKKQPHTHVWTFRTETDATKKCITGVSFTFLDGATRDYGYELNGIRVPKFEFKSSAQM